MVLEFFWLFVDLREFERKTRQSETLKKKYDQIEKEDVKVREAIKHASDQIKKLQKNIENEEKKVWSILF